VFEIRKTPFAAGCAIAAVLAGGSPQRAEAKSPIQLTATFEEQGRAAAKDAGSCTAVFVETLDERRSPETTGVIGKRAILAPKDSTRWMRAVLSGLPARGVAVRFAAAEKSEVAATFRFRTAWIDENPSTYDANVVVMLEAKAPSGSALTQSYRGRASRGTYFSGGGDVMQKAIDGAFAKALDQMATDLKRLCAGELPAA
jgi:uncharacterized lipoprotein YajG